MTRRLFVLLSLLTVFTQSALAVVLAIDYGSDFIKASVMAPGVPFDVLLNKDSKRKIPSSVAWKKDDRIFGTDAFNAAGRFPKDSFSSLKFVEGAPFDSDATALFTTISTSDIFETSRGTVGFRRSDGTEWSTEELIGMQFAYVKQLAESVAGEKVHDVVLVVPPFYTQQERDAVADAVELSGLRLLTLMHDGAAVAVNYAMTRTFDTPEYHVIYDAGASSVRAAVVSFATAPETKKTAVSTVLNVAGVGYDRQIGGSALDRRLREILADQFDTKHKKYIRRDPRGMAKLWRETARVKAVLSLNNEAASMVEGLHADIDFKGKVTRDEFEKDCEDMTKRWAQPIFDALTNAGLTMDNITSVIFHGGATRTPMVQRAVKAAIGGDKIANNVNTDEAAVLGAALYGAGLSGRFRVKNIKLSDIQGYDITGTYFAAPSTPLSRPRTISNTIFPAGSKVGTKKTLTFKRKEDFSLFIDYKDEPARGFPQRILEAEITGIAEALKNLTEAGAVDPVIKATVVLSESGLVSVRNAHAYGEIKDDSLTGKLKSFLGGKGDDKADSEDTTDSTSSDTTSSSTVTDSTSPSDSASEGTASGSSSSSAAQASPSPEKKKSDKQTVPLTITMKWPEKLAPMTAEAKKASYRRLLKIDQKEQAKVRREEARNGFESYLYRMKDLLDESNTDTPFKKCSSEIERKEMAERLDELTEWMHEHGDDAEVTKFMDKRNILETLEAPVIHRYEEISEFPAALNASQWWNFSTRVFVREARINITREASEDLPSKWTLDEVADLEKTLVEHEKWLNEWVEKQKSVKMFENPVIETKEMKARAKVLETALARLAKRKVPKKVKPKVTVTKEAEDKPEETGGQAPPVEETQVPIEERRDEL